jgi:hypothetical protein
MKIRKLPLTRIKRYQVLAIFGDNKPHDWFNVMFLGVNFIKDCTHSNAKGHNKNCGVHQKNVECWVKKCLADGLIKQVEPEKIKVIKQETFTTGIGYVIGWEEYDYQLTPKGDECLRNEQMARGGDSFYYKGFDRDPKNDKYADNIRLPKKDK